MKEFVKYILLASGLIAIWGVLVEPVHAQGENNIWTFGTNGGGLNFNSGSPVIFKSSMESNEGCASISDAFGNLLFYTSGNMVWDRNGDPMPNGNILGNGWNGSGVQAALILKSLSNPDEYYIFTLDVMELSSTSDTNFAKLRYSVVNMNLNNGFGDVLLSKKDIVLDKEMEERMVAVKSNDCGYWIIGHKRFSNIYAAYKLTSNGISPPVYSYGTQVGFYRHMDIGEMKISPDGTKIITHFSLSAAVEIGEFDNISGVIYNTHLLEDRRSFGSETSYGAAFSPDNNKLYLTLNGMVDLCQYDMTLFPSVLSMKANKFIIAKDSNRMNNYWGLRLGPDNKIYIVNAFTGYISRINDPNNFGLSCNYDAEAVLVPSSGYYYGLSLGNPTVAVTYKDTLPGKYLDTLICFSDSVQLAVEDNLLGYVWNDGITGASRYVHEEGIYYCLSTKECTMRRDTFKVTFVKGNFPGLGADTIICPGDSLVLSASGDGFQWQDGSTEPEYRVTQPGWYSVTVNEKGCYYSDSIRVAIYAPKAEILENDTLICRGQKLFLHGLSEPAGNFRWNTGSEEASLQITESGRYILEATNLCGVFYDSVRVQVQDCDCQPGIPTAFSPNNDGVNDMFKIILNCLPKSFGLSVYNRFGERIYAGYSLDDGWDGTYKGQQVDVGVYFYDLKYETPNGTILRKTGDIVLVR